MVGNQNLVTKVYFPRLIIPMSAVGAGLVDFVIAFGMLVVLMAYYGVAPGWGEAAASGWASLWVKVSMWA